MTTNQLMVLLDINRGTFKKSRHMACVKGDLATLMYWHLVKAPTTDELKRITKDTREKEPELTQKGEALIRTLLEVASL